MTAATDNEVIEGTATEIAHYQPAPPAALFGTTDPTEVIEKAAAVATALADVVERQHLFVEITSSEGTKRHVTVEGWQLLGVMLGVTAVGVGTDPVDGGYKATVEARAADGRVIGRADAMCTKLERRWRSSDDYARLSMAQTRATSKSLKGPLGFIVNLAGYSSTPAEEIDERQARADAAAAQAPAVGTVSRVSADAPEQTELMATPAQKRKIEARASEKGMVSIDLLNALRVAAGQEKVDWDDARARNALARNLDRLPRRFVTKVLREISKFESVTL